MDRVIDWDALDDALLDDLPGGREREEFRITDLDTAAWASEVLARNANDLADKEAMIEARMERLKELRKGYRKEAHGRATFLEGHLHTFLHRRVQEGHKKSLDLPGGTIKVRSGRDSIEIEDEEAVLAALEEAGADEAIKIKKSVSKTGLGKVTEIGKHGRLVLKATGETLEGCFREPGIESFSFKPDPSWRPKGGA